MSGARPPTAFLDASSLYPAALRNLLMRLALAEVYRARWSVKIQEEWVAALMRDRPDLSPERIARTRTLMEAHIDDAIVIGYEPLMGRLTLPDPDDRHVLAAAIRGNASVIVTMNLKDFPPAALAPHGIEAMHPDTFVRMLIERDAAEVVATMRKHRLSLKAPPKTVAEYLATLDRLGMTETAAAARPHRDDL